jgi:hypothetical protein
VTGSFWDARSIRLLQEREAHGWKCALMAHEALTQVLYAVLHFDLLMPSSSLLALVFCTFAACPSPCMCG